MVSSGLAVTGKKIAMRVNLLENALNHWLSNKAQGNP
jgi:hypothetical protein